ncbi:MAG: hypothetical protein F6J92_03310 [Symploca sp. SIO1A3]|nr:hypothetical protein [Symploca sp. SIO1A3]
MQIRSILALAAANSLTTETISIAGGNAETIGGAGKDTINDTVNFYIHGGGSGIDTIYYSNVTFAASLVTINLAARTTSVAGSNTKTILNFENIEGSQGGETIIGSSDANRLDGNGGNDTLEGQGGADTLIGDSGDDSLDSDTLGTVDNIGDLLDGGAGNDTLQGFEGFDCLADIDDIGIEWYFDDQLYDADSTSNDDNLLREINYVSGDTLNCYYDDMRNASHELGAALKALISRYHLQLVSPFYWLNGSQYQTQIIKSHQKTVCHLPVVDLIGAKPNQSLSANLNTRFVRNQSQGCA